MQQNSDILSKVDFLIGTKDVALSLPSVVGLPPFSDDIIEYLNDVSKRLMKNVLAKSYPDVITFAFWIRKSSVLKLKKCFDDEKEIKLGKGVVFHIAPSNVPVNFAYSLAVGLMTGNCNVVRVPSKSFPQVDIIVEALVNALNDHIGLRKYIICIRYDRDRGINDYFSSFSDMRIIWGGDTTVAEVRKSPLMPRSGEITFADRYSITVIDSDKFLSIDNKKQVAENFYNDTFLSDQNACTSPRLVAWIGNSNKKAKEEFWKEVHLLVEQNYSFQDIQGVNKYTRFCIAAAALQEIKLEQFVDNLIVRVSIGKITDGLIEQFDNSGYFYEYECEDIMDLFPLCNNKRCQTIGYIGDKDMFLPLLNSGTKGIDRIVPVGKTMNFGLIWDGYNLPALLTRTIYIE